jgi:hypothetical protein
LFYLNKTFNSLMVKLVNFQVLECPLADFFSTSLCIAHNILYNIDCVNVMWGKWVKITRLIFKSIVPLLYGQNWWISGFWDAPSHNFQALPPVFKIVFCRLWYELTYIEKEKKLSHCLISIWTNLTLDRHFIIYSNIQICAEMASDL